MGPPDPEQPQPPEQRVRKRRRRTMACTQCRSRKLRCDREYPTCGRCLKSKTPTKCTYEDGFLWQQPNTVASPVFSDRGSTVLAQMPRVDRAPALTTPDSGISSLPPRSQPPPLPSTPQCRHGEEKRSFLETVLGAPKAGVNQEPYVNTEVLQRPRHPPESRHEAQRQPLEDDDELASPSQQLDILPRIMMRGKETKTRFNGSGILANLIAQVSSCHMPLTFLLGNALAVPRHQVICGGGATVESEPYTAPLRPGKGKAGTVEKKAVE